MLGRDDIEKQIIEYERRLQILEILRAKQGLSVEPKILIEIEDIKAEIEGLQKKRAAMTDKAEELPQGQADHSKPSEASPTSSRHESPLQIFTESNSYEFRKCVEDLIDNARNQVILIGTGLNILRNETFKKKIIKLAANKKPPYRLEIYMADPTSPAVETRLIEEEIKRKIEIEEEMEERIKPSMGRSGIRRQLETLIELWEQYNCPDTISIKLFTHYPTFALLIIDDEYFTYSYAYATVGDFSPVLWFSKDNPATKDVIKFFDGQYKRVKASALDAKSVFEIRNNPQAIALEKLIPFALYFIPSKDSAFYQFGTKVLGYDIRENKELEPGRWQEQVGSAREFGFHMTLCDALYFLNESQVNNVKAEIKFLAEGFRPFDLNLRLQSGFPDAASLAVSIDDPSGSLEALHYELVQRVYRRAVASNYSLRLAKPTRDKDVRRARLMIKRYRAPYILQRFHPHFTLLTNVRSEEMLKTHQNIEKFFSSQVSEPTIRVENLAIMARPDLDAPWIIAEEIRLGRD